MPQSATAAGDRKHLCSRCRKSPALPHRRPLPCRLQGLPTFIPFGHLPLQLLDSGPGSLPLSLPLRQLAAQGAQPGTGIVLNRAERRVSRRPERGRGPRETMQRPAQPQEPALARRVSP